MEPFTTLIGQANHIHDDGDISVIKIHTIENVPRLAPFVTLSNEYDDDSLTISSLEQWKQLDAFVRKAFNDLNDK